MASKIKVLIVDDHHETRENLYHMLQLAGDIDPIAHASTGMQALDMARLYRPDVILMDVKMPGVDGVVASQAILQYVPSTKIVMMSGQPEIDHQWGAMLVGATDFLTKPFTARELAESVRRAVGI
ncbi:MAG: response regulator transcription factor [Candidatus Promineifilaceae bacterium]